MLFAFITVRHSDECSPACVALTRPRKFAPFPVRMFFRGDSRPFAATCGEPPRLAASCGLNPIQYNTIQYSAPDSPKQHYSSFARVQSRFRIPAESSRSRCRQFWRYLLGMEQNVPPAGVFCKARREPKKKTLLLSSERAQERFLLCGSIISLCSVFMRLCGLLGAFSSTSGKTSGRIYS